MDEANFKGLGCHLWQSASLVWQWKCNQDFSQSGETLQDKAYWIQYHFIRDHIRRGEIELNYVNTLDNLADIFTKPLDEARFRELRHELNIIDSSNVAWTRAHPTILNLLSCLDVGMDIGGVLFYQWTLPPPIMHKLINSFTLAIFLMELVLQRRVLVMGPRIILRGAIPFDSNIGGSGHRPCAKVLFLVVCFLFPCSFLVLLDVWIL